MNNFLPAIVTPYKAWGAKKTFLKDLEEFVQINRTTSTEQLNEYLTSGRLIYTNPFNGKQEEDLVPSRSVYLTSPNYISAKIRLFDVCLEIIPQQAQMLIQNAVLACELSSICDFLVESEFPAKFNRNLKNFSFRSYVGYFALAAATGAMEVLERWGPLLVEAMRRGYVLDDEYRGMLHFTVRLWCTARGIEYPEGKYPRYEVAEGVLKLWNTTDVDLLDQWLVQLCNQHTRLSASRDFMDFASEFSHIPVEVLLLFRLREEIGLANPVVDHPIMKFPWSRLWPIQAAQPDELLSAIYRRLEQDEGITVAGLYQSLLYT